PNIVPTALIRLPSLLPFCLFFSFPDPPPTEIYTLSLHDALPIFPARPRPDGRGHRQAVRRHRIDRWAGHAVQRAARRICARSLRDRKSTRLNSSHRTISYAVFCLKKKNREESGGVSRRLIAPRCA